MITKRMKKLCSNLVFACRFNLVYVCVLILFFILIVIRILDPGKGMKVKGLYDYQTDEEDGLSFKEGQVITIVEVRLSETGGNGLRGAESGRGGEAVAGFVFQQNFVCITLVLSSVFSLLSYQLVCLLVWFCLITFVFG